MYHIIGSSPGCIAENYRIVDDDENFNADDRVLSLYTTDDVFSLAGMLDTVCLVAFCIELGLRAGVYSWWIGPDAVLRNPWVLLDVYLVVSHGVGTAASVREPGFPAKSKKYPHAGVGQSCLRTRHMAGGHQETPHEGIIAQSVTGPPFVGNTIDRSLLKGDYAESLLVRRGIRCMRPEV